MARKRMVDPSIWKDPDVAKLAIPERLLFIGIFSNADDEGRIIATPESLKADIFPYDRQFSAARVKKLRDNVVKVIKNVHLYENAHVEYIQLLKWNQYQKPSHPRPSKYPPPPQFLEDKGGKFQESGKETFQEPSKEALQEPGKESFAPSIGKVSIGKVSIPYGGFAALKEELNKSKNKIGVLVDAFKACHVRAPPADFENLGGRLAGILKTISNDYNYLLELIWDTRSIEIAGSHLNYIQGRIRGAKSRGRRLPTDEERERSLR